METGRIKKMLKGIETALAAASFAEEGEQEAAHAFMKESRRVLLAVKPGRIDARTLKYALNTAKRIGASLDILSASSGNDRESALDPLLRSFETELEKAGIPYRLVLRTGCLKQQIVEYTNSEKEILFAVIESPDSLEDDCNKKDKELSELWRQLRCPLVVVMDGARA